MEDFPLDADYPGMHQIDAAFASDSPVTAFVEWESLYGADVTVCLTQVMGVDLVRYSVRKLSPEVLKLAVRWRRQPMTPLEATKLLHEELVLSSSRLNSERAGELVELLCQYGAATRMPRSPTNGDFIFEAAHHGHPRVLRTLLLHRGFLRNFEKFDTKAFGTCRDAHCRIMLAVAGGLAVRWSLCEKIIRIGFAAIDRRTKVCQRRRRVCEDTPSRLVFHARCPTSSPESFVGLEFYKGTTKHRITEYSQERGLHCVQEVYRTGKLCLGMNWENLAALPIRR